MTDLIVVLEPQEILALKTGIDWVERGTGGLSNQVSYFSGPAEHKIVYATDLEAMDAVDDWLLGVNGPPDPIQPGDHITVSMNTHIKGALGQDFPAIFIAYPTVANPYWTVETTDPAPVIMYLTNVTLSKIL